MESVGIYLLIALFLLPFLFIISRNFSSSSSRIKPPIPPGPTPWPIIGNIHQMGELPHVSLANFAKIHGPIMSLKLGSKLIVVGSSPAAAMEIMKTHDRILCGRDVPRAHPTPRSELNHKSLAWTQDCNESWRNLRALCRAQLFSGRALEAQESVRGKKVSEMVEFLKGREGKVVDIGQLFFATSFNMLSNILVSRDLISLEEEVEHNLMKGWMRGAIDVLSAPNLPDFYPVLGELDVQGIRKKGKKVWQRMWTFWEPIVEQRRQRKHVHEASPIQQQDFLDSLVDHDFSDDGILTLLMELFSGGSDTSTSTIEWMMTELMTNPKSMERLREELEREIKDHPIIEPQLMQLPYLQACIKEALRLHPPTPLLVPRQSLDSCKVMNYTIPRNTQVLVNVWAIGRDPQVWEEPLKFRPERFLDSGVDFKGNDFGLLPFGAGRRICPGYPMAARQMSLIVASAVHLFDWCLPDGEIAEEMDMNESFGITLQKKKPLLLIPRAR